ncbi:ABC transporter ATP-binding protein [Salinibacterium sp. SYSU T00001]|uniref:dipeptide ABC transporter ATP-binding protein n=1 Tax=Homoserinimonas sedimenticola TaxID=2986805 RepID=UPI0022358FC2|nr:ABC transporter ATP-binding protein [Salinibacterium sedimenticola]MCW4384689.1 ABC transporter ATP-binding protein [Salinibacterium sedimenticola]
MTDDTGVLLAVRSLRVAFDLEGDSHVGVADVSFEVGAGEILAIVGESGSGKSVASMAVLGLLPENASVEGAIEFEGRDILGLSAGELRGIRGSGIAMIFQDPVAALNPVFTVGFQIVEAVRAQNGGLPKAQARRRAVELLELVGIPDAERRLDSYPHQLSGGQCQRVMIAMALAGEPRLLIADEPTTALDVTVQAEILDVLRSLRDRVGLSILMITHDMGVVADIADRVVVMKEGNVVERGNVAEIFTRPQAEYTHRLLSAVPRFGGRDDATHAESTEATLSVRSLVVEYGGRLRGLVRAVDDVSLSVAPGEILGVVGESGSGKTTIGRAVIGLAPVTAGTIEVCGVDLATRDRVARQRMRRRVGVVFQNPATSLNPRFSVAETVSEPLRMIARLRGSELSDRTDALLASVGLDGRWRERYSHELSGGQRQRVAIARAVALDPDLLIADEPTSALDVSVQARVLDVFRELQERLGFACVFISHDLAVVDSLCDSVAVMHRGRVVEQGSRARVLFDPAEEYTRRLIASAPVPDPAEQRLRREARRAV